MDIREVRKIKVGLGESYEDINVYVEIDKYRFNG